MRALVVLLIIGLSFATPVAVADETSPPVAPGSGSTSGGSADTSATGDCRPFCASTTSQP